ncbi:Phospholipase A1 precursor [Legionella beliardensis]|uniref:Phospholipase A1 n=1 Tax=Legionella beliardensis TaxID=91822 RepID=A0A378I242_9GAMM|nr:phospholipase A [Legionella beliardensis]STX28771.1 Phospholipase A1 precursor [Legionella beliardensis]
MKVAWLFCPFLSLFLLSSVAFSETANEEQVASSTANEKTILEKRVREKNKTKHYSNIVNLYHPNYILPYYRTGRPYQSIYWEATPNNQFIMQDELKAQISFLVPLIHHLLDYKPLSLNFAYTQLMYWQVYADSQYFRETNYEPEFFIENYFNPYIATQIGINHQSNGRGGVLERSWNRVILQLQFSGTRWLAHIRGWALIDQAKSSDLHNPNIAYYLGYENLLFSYKFSSLKASIEAQNIASGLKRGFVQVTLSYPLLKALSIYGQFFSGYGQSLIEYDHRTTSFGIGVALNDWMN